MPALVDFAAHLTTIRADEDAVVRKLSLHVGDTIGALLSAMPTDEGRALCGFVRSTTPLAQVGPSDLADRVALHCALARSSEIDDIHLASLTTPGSIVIPAALMMTAHLPECDEHDAACAMLCGYEAMVRMGHMIDGANVLYRGIWPTYFLSSVATAAVAARLFRFDAMQTAHALSLALTLASPNVGNHHASTTARWWLVGQAARGGIMAAMAVRRGFTADLAILESNLLSQVFGLEINLKALMDGVGQRKIINELGFKLWCASRQTMTATQALRVIMEEGVAADDIKSVTAFIPPPHFKMTAHGVEQGDRASFLTSLPFQLAIMALMPEKQFDLSPADELLTPALARFMARVSVVPDDGLMTNYPAEWTARVTVETSRGTKSAMLGKIPGDFALCPTEAELESKFGRFTRSMTKAAKTERLWRDGLRCPQSANVIRRLAQDLDRIARDI